MRVHRSKQIEIMSFLMKVLMFFYLLVKYAPFPYEYGPAQAHLKLI